MSCGRMMTSRNIRPEQSLSAPTASEGMCREAERAGFSWWMPPVPLLLKILPDCGGVLRKGYHIRCGQQQLGGAGIIGDQGRVFPSYLPEEDAGLLV